MQQQAPSLTEASKVVRKCR